MRGYCSQQQSFLANIPNYDRKLEEENNFYFNTWVNINKGEKYQKYKTTMRSNEYYDEKIFIEKAKKDYLSKIWPEEKKQLIIQLMNINEELFDKFINLKIAGFLIS